MPSRKLAKVLRQLRDDANMTQEELAKKAKVARSYVALIEAGHKKNPSLESLRRLAKALEVSVDDLMTGIDPQEKLRRLKAAEVLREAALGGRTRAWFEGLSEISDSYVAGATKALEEAGLVERTRDRRSYRATERGQNFLARNGLGDPDWIIRAPTIDFP